MNHPAFTQLRRQIDAAITFQDIDLARRSIDEGLDLARQLECPAETLYFRAQEAIITARPQDAITLLYKALALNPLDGAAYNDIALCMIELGKLDGVLELFDRGIAIEPDYATIHHNKGWLLNNLGSPAEALACFERALVFEPRRAVTWENMANAYEALDRASDALHAYRKALSFLEGPGREIREQLEAEIKRLESSCSG